MSIQIGVASVRPLAEHRPQARPFRLLDAMILVAATGAGCAVANGMSVVTDDEISWPRLWKAAGDAMWGRANPRWALGVTDICAVFFLNIAPIVAMWGVALLPIRLIGPRPRWRRLARQPGLMAACATTLTLAMVALFWAGLGLGGPGFMAQSNGPVLLMLASVILIAVAILVAWMTLLLGGRWRAEPSWIDRLGRALGVFWLLSAVPMVAVLFE